MKAPRAKTSVVDYDKTTVKTVDKRDWVVPTFPKQRFRFLLDLYAPEDLDGVRRPENGCIELGQFERLMNA